MCVRLSVLLVIFASAAQAAVLSEDALLETALDRQAGAVERTRAFSDLQAVATEKSIAALAPMLVDPAWSPSARGVLESLAGAAVDRALLEALAVARDGTVRAGLARSLGHRRLADAVPELVKLLGSSDAALVDAALDALGEIATVRAAEALRVHAPTAASMAIWADASLRAAEMLRTSDQGKALELYRAVQAKGPPTQAAAARIGLARGLPQPADAIASLLRSDEHSRAAALAVIRSGELGAPLTAAVGQAFPELSSPVQVQALSVLYDRGDRGAAPIARRALAAREREVRAAAAKLLSVVGEPADTPALVRMMVGPEEPALSARLALARIPGAAITDALVELFHQGGDIRLAALEVLVQRGYRAVVPELLDPKLHADESLRAFAVNALLALGTGDDLGRVLEFHRTLPSAQRAALEPAVRRIAAKHPLPDVAAAAIVAAAEKLPLAEAAPLYAILAGNGGDAALASLAGMAKSDSGERRMAALRALGNWRDAAPTAMLLEMARDDSDTAARALAVRSATTLFTRSAFAGNNAPVPDRVPAAIEGLRRTWTLARQPAEKNAAVAALRSLKTPPAIAAADELDRRAPQAK